VALGGQLEDRRYKPGTHFVVRSSMGQDHSIQIRRILDKAAWEVSVGEAPRKKHIVEGRWLPNRILYEGRINGQHFALQVEKRGLWYRIWHRGTQIDLIVLSARLAQLQSLMPEKVVSSDQRHITAPMPGLLTYLGVRAGDQVRKGAVLAKIEAMKMENALFAERDCVVESILAMEGEIVSVDQAIIVLE